MNDLFKLSNQFYTILVEAQKLRRQKSKWIGDELEWVIYERLVMLDAVNAERSQRGLLPVRNVDAAERCAVGHIDYTRKFALYCAELVLQ